MSELMAFIVDPQFFAGLLAGLVLEETGRRGIKRVFKSEVKDRT